MATLVDELQNDFADSGDEEELLDEQMAEDEDVADGDDVQMTEDFAGEAEEETEARLEKERRAQNVPKDMQSVLRFVKTVEPVLEVSSSLSTCEQASSLHLCD